MEALRISSCLLLFTSPALASSFPKIVRETNFESEGATPLTCPPTEPAGRRLLLPLPRQRVARGPARRRPGLGGQRGGRGGRRLRPGLRHPRPGGPQQQTRQ